MVTFSLFLQSVPLYEEEENDRTDGDLSVYTQPGGSADAIGDPDQTSCGPNREGWDPAEGDDEDWGEIDCDMDAQQSDGVLTRAAGAYYRVGLAAGVGVCSVCVCVCDPTPHQHTHIALPHPLTATPSPVLTSPPPLPP